MVDGLPLAIELAAAWVRILDPATLRNRLAEGAPLLRSDARDRPERHRTLTSTIDWTTAARSRGPHPRLAGWRSFRATFRSTARWRCCRTATAPLLFEALETIDLLAQVNLLQTPTQTSEGPRYSMLQTIQEFALGTLVAEERIAASRVHADYFATMSASAASIIRDAEAPVWLKRLDANMENLRTAVSWFASPESAKRPSMRWKW